MPLIGIPDSITPELLFGLAKMGHGDTLVIADANFPSDSVAKGDRNSSSCITNKYINSNQISFLVYTCLPF